MLSSAERIPRAPMPVVNFAPYFRVYGNTAVHPIDVVTVDRFPQRKPHVRLTQMVLPVAKIGGNDAMIGNDDRMKRIMREVSHV